MAGPSDQKRSDTAQSVLTSSMGAALTTSTSTLPPPEQSRPSLSPPNEPNTPSTHSASQPSITTSASATQSLAITTATTIPSTTSSDAIIHASTPSTIQIQVDATSSTNIDWGPAITAPSTTGYTARETVAPDVSSSQSGNVLSKGSRDILIATTVIGGTFIVALLLYAICRRRKGESVSQIFHFRRSATSTVLLTPGPRQARLTTLPIYRESRYSVHSSKHLSALSFSKARPPNPTVPPEVAQRFQVENAYIESSWKTAKPSWASRDAEKEASTSHDDDAVVPLVPPKPPELVYASNRSVKSLAPSARSRTSHGPVQPLPVKPELAISIRDLAASPVEADCGTPPPDTADFEGHLQDMQKHWSWTNSQAPSTPRLYASSPRSSRASLPRFRSVVDWVRGQNERIDEERPLTAPAQPDRSGRPPVLRNQASKPNLAPRKLSKNKIPTASELQRDRSSSGGISSVFRSPSRPRTAGSGTRKSNSDRPKTAPDRGNGQRSRP